MGRHVLPLMLLVCVATPCFAGVVPEIAVLPPPPAPEPEPWVSLRLADRVALDLSRLGLVVWDRRALASSFVPRGALSVRVEGQARGDGWIGRVTIGDRPVVERAGGPEDLDSIAAALALSVARAAGAVVRDDIEPLLSRDRLPLLVHRLLGQAELDLVSGVPVRARMRFERTAEIWKTSLTPDAYEGAWRVRAVQLASEGGAISDKGDLGRTALERAEFAEKERRIEDAITGYRAALRYLPDRSWSWIATRPEGGVLIAADNAWWLSFSDGVERIDPILGASSGGGDRARGLLVGRVGGHELRLEGKKLSRVFKGVAKWKLDLPFVPASRRLIASGGFVAAISDDSVVWIDLGLGKVAQQARGVVPLAVGPDGVVIASSSEIALLRPGRKAAAWRVQMPGVSHAFTVRGRVMVTSSTTLTLLDASNGKVRGAPFKVAPSASWIGSHARYAVLAHGSSGFDIFDVLAGTRTAELQGPARALAATAIGDAIVVAFASGDVITYDRDGVMIDRAWVPGVPLELHPGLPSAPGFLLRTDRALHAFGEPPSPGKKRDVDIALHLAQLLSSRGDIDGGLRIAEQIALRSAGRIAEAEQLRATLLASRTDAASRAAAALAQARAATVRDGRKVLPRFSF